MNPITEGRRQGFTFRWPFAHPGLLSACLIVSTLQSAAQSNYATAYTFTTFAGYADGAVGSADGVGSTAQFSAPGGVVVDGVGNVYVADTRNSTIRKVTPDGVVTTIAGFPGATGSADGTNSTARFNNPGGLTLDISNNLYVADTGNHTIRKLFPVGTNWVVTTLAGSAGVDGSANGIGTSAQFAHPQSLAVDTAGNVFVADADNQTIRKIGPSGEVSTIAGLVGVPGTNDGVGAMARFSFPHGVAVDSTGIVYVADFNNHTIRQLTLVGTDFIVQSIAGLAGQGGSADGTGTVARFSFPWGLAADGAGNLYVGDFGKGTIRKMSRVGTDWAVTTMAGLAGNFGGADGTGATARFGRPTGVAVDGVGNVYVADAQFQTIRKINSASVVRTLAGAGAASAGSAEGTGSAARFNQPGGVAVDRAGSIYVADTKNETVRQITSLGVVSTLAGLAGNRGYTNGAGSDARFGRPAGIAVDNSGNIFVTESANHTVRKITPLGVVSTVAGLAGTNGFADGTNAAARFNSPYGVAMDGAGNLYVADELNHTIRQITPDGTNWVVRTIAGLAGSPGAADGTNADARFNFPYGLAVTAGGMIYVADTFNYTIRQITKVDTNWVVTTMAGSAGAFASIDGTGANARFRSPWSMAMNGAGHLYVADELTIREMIPTITPIETNWMVTTIGGLSGISGSSDGAGSAARFNMGSGSGIAVDSAGNVYVADTFNNTIRKAVFTQYSATNPVPYVQPGMNGQLTVTLLPPEADGQWRFPWELRWRTNGQTATNLVAGNYDVEFRARPGWVTPLRLSGESAVGVPDHGLTSITNYYVSTQSMVNPGSNGTLTVKIEPSAPPGAGWRFIGDTATYPPGYTTNLSPDTYLIEFAAVTNWSKPASRAVQVLAGLPSELKVNYLLAAPPPAGKLLPMPVPVNQISNVNSFPFGFNGQLQSDHGYGSGVAVQENVVLTAAHLVFDDQNKSYVSQAYWYFQREAGVFEPKPLAARGWCVLSGYSAQRNTDLLVVAPDASTPQSRNFDVAALYFLSPVAGGGHGGFLPSDAMPNTWLAGNSLKMLVGYPVDGSQFGDASIVPGSMYRTEPQPYSLSLAPEPVANQQVYTASWFLSYPGNSGGPVYVLLNGYYYPAGVYLGTVGSPGTELEFAL